MFDSQKLSVDYFLNSYKHGIYVFTDDTCLYCQEYKESIAYINNANLYFVEVSTNRERETINKLLDRLSYPMTACFKNNKLEYVKLGKLYGTQLVDIMQSLKYFGDKPLTDSEKLTLLEKEKHNCVLTYYIIPEDVTDSEREAIIKKSIEYNELPFDVDKFAIFLSFDERFHLLEHTLENVKIVIYRKNSRIFSDICEKILLTYAALNNDKPDFKWTIRKVSDILTDKEYDSNNTNK